MLNPMEWMHVVCCKSHEKILYLSTQSHFETFALKQFKVENYLRSDCLHEN